MIFQNTEFAKMNENQKNFYESVLNLTYALVLKFTITEFILEVTFKYNMILIYKFTCINVSKN